MDRSKPTLVIMAAGMGSRFGGLKQVAAVDGAGHAIIDFSLYDARRAGFENVVFIIKHAIEKEFRAALGDRMERYFHVDYVFQELDALPEGFDSAVIPEGRVKPWGTGHALACCHGTVQGPFAVINADDFYGPGAYQAIHGFLTGPRRRGECAMLGYRLRNTITENGSVSRGVCDVENGMLRSITERVQVVRRGSAAAYIENGAEYPLTGDEAVSMNFWGFGPEMLDAFRDGFPAFLRERVPANPLKSEYFLPDVVAGELRSGRATVRVLPCGEVWHGVTYPEDLPSVREAVAALKRSGAYPENLWE